MGWIVSNGNEAFCNLPLDLTILTPTQIGAFLSQLNASMLVIQLWSKTFLPVLGVMRKKKIQKRFLYS